MGTRQARKYEAMKQGGYTIDWFMVINSDGNLAQSWGAMDLNTLRKKKRRTDTLYGVIRNAPQETTPIDSELEPPKEPEYQDKKKKTEKSDTDL